MTGVRVSPLSYKRLEQFAVRARSVIRPKLTDGPRICGEDLFERIDQMKVDGTPLTYGVKSDQEMKGMEAFTYYDPRGGCIVVTLAARVHQDLCRGNPRALFTLLHELAHALLHHVQLRNAQLLQHGLARGGGHPPYEDSEWQADAFAAAFLMPATTIEEMALQTPDDLERAFGVSHAAAKVRLRVFRSHRAQLIGGT